MPSRTALLNNHPVMHSSDPEQARACLLSTFGITGFDIPGGGAEFEARANHLQVGELGLSYCAYANDVSLGFEEATFIRQIFNIDGSLRYSGASVHGEIASGSCSTILPAGVPLKLDFLSGYSHLVLRIELEALQRYLGALIGEEVGDKLVFDDVSDQLPAMKRLRRMIFQFASDYDARGALFSDLAAAEMKRIVIMKFLMYHRHNYSQFLFRKPLTSTSSTVRTVEEYVEANWDKPVDIEAMSRIAKVSARSLFRQFKNDRGYSPMDFAKRIRLDRAREMLERGSEGTSVTQVALRCGFQNPGHFARDFRLMFGELPSETLRRSSKRQAC
jgi:AraC-like DNA-binding protein